MKCGLRALTRNADFHMSFAITHTPCGVNDHQIVWVRVLAKINRQGIISLFPLYAFTVISSRSHLRFDLGRAYPMPASLSCLPVSEPLAQPMHSGLCVGTRLRLDPGCLVFLRTYMRIGPGGALRLHRSHEATKLRTWKLTGPARKELCLLKTVRYARPVHGSA